ncbi:MAG: aminoacyl-tRNA hydrolase [Gammaproteobacteria bacterium]|nr:aminoacyl-tRNA hydrolase [Gammaproteobacteria bacterium]MDH5630644.1 aminoacyl-tRNA hydrolase [Gammaproteobacteria bacterium]
MIKLIVGLGNPGPQYAQTRHNAGIWYVEALARDYAIDLQLETKFYGHSGRGFIEGNDTRLLIPNTFMNLSGKSVGALATFYKILPDEILIAHDELDMPPGTVKLKNGGGHGGHNGLKDIVRALANNSDFHRIRIGIGHPGNKNQVSNYVLNKAPDNEQRAIEESIEETLRYTKDILAGNYDQVMQNLHAFKAG